MLPPMRPNPIIASCIAAPPSDGHGQRREIPAQLWGVVIQNRVHPEPPCGLEVVLAIVDECGRRRLGLRHHQGTLVDLPRRLEDAHPARREERVEDVPQAEDRKSTRLNSSHSQISYAVFCLKKKKSTVTPRDTPTCVA